MEMKEMFEKAHAVGMDALQKKIPTPMIVAQHANCMDDSSPVTKSWFVDGGVCGFAWVHISPARGPFVKWCKDNGIGHKSYYGGFDISVREGGQSLERKLAYAEAFATALRAFGVTSAYADSRMD